MKQIQDPLHQPVTLFLPIDSTMAALPQAQKDFLYGLHNRAQLVEYLKYHILRDKKVRQCDFYIVQIIQIIRLLDAHCSSA